MEPGSKEGTIFNADQEPNETVRIDLHASDLPSTKELEEKKFRAAVDNAFRTVQQVRVENHEQLAPVDHVELARVYSHLVPQMRREHLAGWITGEVNSNVVWLDDYRNKKDQRSIQGNNVVSFDDARRRLSNVGLEDAA